jgi:hypothetical protein
MLSNTVAFCFLAVQSHLNNEQVFDMVGHSMNVQPELKPDWKLLKITLAA